MSWQQLLGYRQITDNYLLGLAARHDCCFVSFDTRPTLDIVAGAKPEHWVRL